MQDQTLHIYITRAANLPSRRMLYPIPEPRVRAVYKRLARARSRIFLLHIEKANVVKSSVAAVAAAAVAPLSPFFRFMHRRTLPRGVYITRSLSLPLSLSLYRRIKTFTTLPRSPSRERGCIEWESRVLRSPRKTARGSFLPERASAPVSQ